MSCMRHEILERTKSSILKHSVPSSRPSNSWSTILAACSRNTPRNKSVHIGLLSSLSSQDTKKRTYIISHAPDTCVDRYCGRDKTPIVYELSIAKYHHTLHSRSSCQKYQVRSKAPIRNDFSSATDLNEFSIEVDPTQASARVSSLPHTLDIIVRPYETRSHAA
jgi:hypothetical protein